MKTQKNTPFNIDPEKLQEIINTSMDGWIIIDQHAKIINCNNQVTSLFGYNVTDTLPHSISSLISYTDNEMTLKTFTKLASLKQKIECFGIKKSGEHFPVELNISCIKTKSGQLFTAFIRDISQQKENEALLLKTKHEAEKTKQHERLFLANMSHEIRTPMNVVIGIIHLLKQSQLSADQIEYVETLDFATDNLMSVISGVLDFTKIEAGEISLNPTPFVLQDIIVGLQKSYKLKVKEKGIDVKVNIDKNINTKVIGDKTKIIQILSNLLSNSSKFTQKGHIGIDVTLSTKPTCKKKPLWINFKIYDTGIGIKQKNLDKIFQNFKQAETTTHIHYGGTGLGLAIVKKLVGILKGKISCDSIWGTGTTFQISLPLQNSNIPIHTEKKMDRNLIHFSPPTPKLTVLVAEDCILNQKLISRMFDLWNYQYDLAFDGLQTLNYAKNKRYDLLFVDFNMPKLNGIEVIKQLRGDTSNPNHQIPIIAITASAIQEEHDQMFATGINDFIAKPFHPIQLKQAITKQLKQEPLFDLNFLAQISNENDSFIKEMIEVFLLQNPIDLEKLKIELMNKNWPILQQIAHRIKSTYRLLGMAIGQNLAEKIEHHTQNIDLCNEDEFTIWVNELTQHCQEVYPLLMDKIHKK